MFTLVPADETLFERVIVTRSIPWDQRRGGHNDIQHEDHDEREGPKLVIDN